MQAIGRRKLTERALALAALVCRGHIETAAGDEKATEMYGLVIQWMQDTDAWRALEDDERRILASAPGTLPRADVARAIFRSEQLAVVAWGCGVVPPLRHDQHPHDRFLAQRVSFLQRDSIARLERAVPRDPDLLRGYARVAVAVEDRLRRFAIDGRPIDFAKEYGLAPAPLAAADLAFDGLPIVAVPESRWHLALAAAVERATAARWLLGPAPQRLVPPRLDGDA